MYFVVFYTQDVLKIPQTPGTKLRAGNIILYLYVEPHNAILWELKYGEDDNSLSKIYLRVIISSWLPKIHIYSETPIFGVKNSLFIIRIRFVLRSDGNPLHRLGKKQKKKRKISFNPIFIHFYSGENGVVATFDIHPAAMRYFSRSLSPSLSLLLFLRESISICATNWNGSPAAIDSRRIRSQANVKRQLISLPRASDATVHQFAPQFA